ncbi:ribosomal L1 domain-containing protein CG13096-like [Coffea eugenioides]|uniref:ribosomal L1 domain-containing protein CG13096-like n=1 Tax=Coffea eugenioides TaxID=49369 RepID=UPI000F614BAC|nr:ribosomal L1 domain-containing protein CG13096-like [Coffea eugenioides]XP_027168415.1 ribosomal L1 domain-containing protein CG13096-like [Coffea eugenioides]
MAFRGRGRGGFRAAKQENFDLFLEIEELGTAESVKVDPSFAVWFSKFQRYWNSSPYYVEDESGGAKKSQRIEIEKHADRKSKKASSKQPLSHFIRMEPDYVPAELAKDEKKEKHGIKRVRWNPKADMQKLDVFEKLEQKHQVQELNGKEDEEEEGDENLEEDEEEYSDDGDYNQNIDFDDDEDDFNMGDDNDDEPEL